jgi:hypothetical protein
MAHQFPNQLRNRGENGQRLYDSIMENASNKVVFRLQHEENLRAMAQWLFMRVMNPDEVKHELYSTKVMDYREELRAVYGEASSSGKSVGYQHGQATGSGYGGTSVFPFDENGIPSSTSESWSSFASDSSSESESYSKSHSESRTLVPTLIPEIGRELFHVQIRSLEEQLFRAMAVLFDQRERHGVARVVGMSAPVSFYTPEVGRKPGKDTTTKRLLENWYRKLPFALPSAEALKRINDRAETFADGFLNQAADEPRTAKRRIS